MVICKVECLGLAIVRRLFYAVSCGVALIVSEKYISYTRADVLGLA